MVDGYRRIRNTLRFLLANVCRLRRRRRHACRSTNGWKSTATRWPLTRATAGILPCRLRQRYEFHRGRPGLADASARRTWARFYLDILKDRLYTTAPKSAARRSAQSALWHITQAFVRLLAPITSFTAEEVWAVLPARQTIRSCSSSGTLLPELAGEGELLAKWSLIRAARADVTKALEAQREAGKIGSALQAAVEVRCAGDKFDALSSLGDDLKFIFIVSAARVVRDDNEQVEATPQEHAKCERCWHVREDVGSDAEHPDAVRPLCEQPARGG